MTFKEVREAWWTGQQFDKSPVTLYRNNFIIEKHIAPFFDDLDIRLIDDVFINNYIQWELNHGNRINGSGLCQNSVIKNLQFINNIFKYAASKNIIAKENNPMLLVPKLKKTKTKEFSVFSFEEIEKLIVSARPKWLGNMILLAYLTGMRRGEIYGLQWKDIDFSVGFLTVNRSVTSYAADNKFIGEPKSSTSHRKIKLDERTMEMIERRWKLRKSEEWVFANQYGQLMSPWYNVKYFRKTCVKAGIPIRRFHDLRHTHITDLVEAGVPLPIVQQRAGHSDIKMTMRYTHINPQMQQTAVDFLNKRNKHRLEKAS